jgi:RNA polymerase-binding transcription factor DksA
MRHHFHRCGYLRVLEVEAADRSGERKGGAQILEELCEARRLAPCVGLAECEVLSPAQKRDLLVTRATRLREEDGGRSPLADAPDSRGEELRTLREALLEERDQILAENRRWRAEAGAALQRNPRAVARSEEGDLERALASVFYDEASVALRSARLDAIERGLEAMGRPDYGRCVRCRGEIDVRRLREAPDTVVCLACARQALPDRLGSAGGLDEAGARHRSA